MSKRNTAVAVAIGVALITLLVSSASVFAVASQAERLLADAQLSRQIDDTLLASQSVQSSLDLLLFVSAAAEEGVVSEDQLGGLRSATTAQIEVLRESMVAAGVGNPELVSVLERAADEATSEVHSRAQQALIKNEAALNETRSMLAGRMAAATAQQSRVAQVASFAVAFLVPLSFMVIYRTAARRRARNVRLRAQFARQVELSNAKNELIGGLSHELRTPLTSIYGLASAVDESPDDPVFMREMNGLILSEAADLDRMVTDLLTAAKADSDGLAFTPGSTDVGAELAMVVAPFARRGTEITVNIEDRLTAWVDRFRFRHLVRNLLSNADTHGGAPISITASRTDSWVRIEVVDGGSGVSPEVEVRMFERFVHAGDTPLVTGSVGIGLSIVRLLADRMGGEVTYLRRDDQTVFRVDLPAETSAADQLVKT